jgi:hypothetical protein
VDNVRFNPFCSWLSDCCFSFLNKFFKEKRKKESQKAASNSIRIRFFKKYNPLGGDF